MLKEFRPVRYAYGIAGALLLGGTAFSMTTGNALGSNAANSNQIVPVAGAPTSFADLAERLSPAVVNISTTQRIAVRRQSDPFQDFFRRFGAPQQQQEGDEEERTQETGSLGSGFIISPDGYIVTNNHLIQSRTEARGTVDEVIVTLTDRTEYQARIVGRDIDSDLALLKIDGANLPYVDWGNSENVRVGDWVIAIGNPLGLDGTVTAGIVSAIQRGVPQDASGNTGRNRYIQTDASINRGNSGGPMFDMAGNVVGVNSALISPNGANIGIGLAIPADQARPIIEALRRGERPQRGYLGVQLQPIDEDIAASLGMDSEDGELVREVQSGTPAQAAGLRQGDVILSINGQTITPRESVSYISSRLTPGARVPIVIIRDGRRQTIQLTVGERPSDEELAQQIGTEDDDQTGGMMDEENAETIEIGLGVETLTPRIKNALRLPDDVQGVIINRVDRRSDAAEKGLRRGDIILSVNRQEVTTPAEFEATIVAARDAGRSSVLMLIKRGNSPAAFIGIRITD
ncbi:Do family serine endopeptidase [Sphingomicrobium flavum]|uniref:Do family serine endopeptidase n=1 Tax=Sphingomicrobium flavum TaxID=1229164 RepID=UPI0021ADB2C5|nr:Do family serine endopeptidase [Sphingomicrobium flavum]